MPNIVRNRKRIRKQNFLSRNRNRSKSLRLHNIANTSIRALSHKNTGTCKIVTFFPRMKAVFRIRIQYFRVNTDQDPIWIQGFDDQKLKKYYSWNFFYIFLFQKLHNGRPNYRRSLQPAKENIQHFKTRNFVTFFFFCWSFLPSWIRIRIPNSKPYPDPKHWMKYRYRTQPETFTIQIIFRHPTCISNYGQLLYELLSASRQIIMNEVFQKKIGAGPQDFYQLSFKLSQ